jgi:hypothetical protein
MLYTLLVLLVYILIVAGGWKMFEKAGQAGWKALIPIYNLYIVFKISWETTYFWVYLVITAITAWFGGDYYSGYASEMTFWIFWVLSLVTTIITCWLAVRTSFAYGHGWLFGILMCFFPYICTIILGFGSSRYVGNRTIY